MTATQIQLQQMMIINKSKQLPLMLKLKTITLDICTWGLWIYMGYYVYSHFDSLMNQPLLFNLYLTDVFIEIFLIVGALLCFNLAWSSFIKIIRRGRGV